MPIAIPPPAQPYNVNVPQAPNLLGMAQQAGTLREMNMQQNAQQQLLPLQVQEQQEKAKQAALATQQQQMQLASQQALMKAIASGDLNKFASSGGTPDTPAFDASGAYQHLIQNGVLPEHAGQLVNQFQTVEKNGAEIYKNLAEGDKTKYQTHLDTHKEVVDDFANVKDQAALTAAIQSAVKIPALEPEVKQAISQLQLADVPAFVQKMNIANELAINAQKQAEATKAKQEADPVFKFSQPDELAKPGAQAAIQAQIDDSKTDDATANRLKALLPKAKVAQDNAINMKEREQRAQQAITQGGAAGAQALAKMLVDRSITVDEMKVRGLTPQFEAQVFGLAQQMDPTWKAPEAAAQSRIAAAPANQQFFGNTDSLLVKGGTLDQLSNAGKNIPQGQIPTFNKVADIISEAAGKGPMAAYAAAILGVADDYSKVMGGQAGGSDTARSQALGLFAGKLSPEQREAAIAQVRQQVLSQRQGRVGQNPYLKDMYPEPENKGGTSKGAGLPSGATHIVPGPDGKNHYTNAQGTVDLGIAP